MPQRVIAISGQPGVGSTTVSKLIAEKLSVNYFSPGRLWKDLARGQLKDKPYYSIFKKLCDKRGIEIPELNEKNDSHAVAKLWDLDFGKSKKFNESTDELQRKLAEKGNIIIDGKLSLRMIKNADIKIWLKASSDSRAERVSKRDSIDIAEAKQLLLFREEKEREEWKHIYGFDYFEQEKDAHLVIDTSNLLPEQIADKIIKCLNQ
jgi:cytidylate kinase